MSTKKQPARGKSMANTKTSAKPLAASIDSMILPPKKKVKVVGKKDNKSSSSSSSSSPSSSSSSNYNEQPSNSKSRGRSKISVMEETMKRVDETVESLAAGENGAKGKARALTPRSKRLNEEYEKIKYQEDVSILPWQRQLKVNRFMADLQVRTHIQELVEPIIQTQLVLKNQLDNQFIKTFEKIEERMMLLETAVFGKEGPERRFEKLEKAHIEIIVAQKTHYEFHKNQSSQLENKLNNEVFGIKSRLQKVELFEQEIQELKSKDSIHEKQLKDFQKELTIDTETFKMKVDEIIDKFQSKIHKLSNNLILTQDRVEKLEDFSVSEADAKAKLEQQLISLKQEIYAFSIKKLDANEFETFVPLVTRNHSQLVKKVEDMNSDIQTSCNYIQKYMPLQVQRALTHVLGFVFPQKDVAWRLNWYNEVRFPLLSAALLTDQGKQNLTNKMKELAEMIQRNPTSIMEIDAEQAQFKNKEELLMDETMLTNALRSVKLHGKAKLLIFSHLDAIEKNREKQNLGDQELPDIEVDFHKLQKEMFDLLIREDPVEAKKLGLIGVHDNTNIFGSALAEEEKEEDNGLETQVQSFVEKFTRELEQRTSNRITKMQEELDDSLKKEVDSVVQRISSAVVTLEEADRVMHLTHLQDMNSFKGVHKDYMVAQERFDQKLQIVIGLEKAYQTILQHVKNSSKVINQLIDLNLQGVNPAPEAKTLERDNSFSEGGVPEIDKFQTQPDTEDKSALEKTATENLHLESQKLEEFTDGLSDYNAGVAGKRTVIQHMKRFKESMASEAESPNSSGEVINLHNYFRQIPSNLGNQVTMSSVKSVKNQQFIQKRNNSRFKQYHMGMTTRQEFPNHFQHQSITQLASHLFVEEDRPKSTAAGVTRNNRLVGNSCVQILNGRSGNSLAQLETQDKMGQPSEANFKNTRELLQTQQSCRTTQNWQQQQPRKGRIYVGKNSNLTSSIAHHPQTSKVFTDQMRSSSVKQPELSAQESRDGGFDRGQALSKLVQLGAETRKLMTDVDGLLFPAKDGQDEATQGEKRILKKINDQKRALNHLPSADKFKKELTQFQHRLNQKSAGQKLIEKAGGFVETQLHFATHGLNMNFGMRHSSQQSQRNLSPDEQKQLALQKRNNTPNRISAEQEFGHQDCALQYPLSRESKQTAHIFCKKEVMKSVARVL